MKDVKILLGCTILVALIFFACHKNELPSTDTTPSQQANTNFFKQQQWLKVNGGIYKEGKARFANENATLNWSYAYSFEKNATTYTVIPFSLGTCSYLLNKDERETRSSFALVVSEKDGKMEGAISVKNFGRLLRESDFLEVEKFMSFDGQEINAWANSFKTGLRPITLDKRVTRSTSTREGCGSIIYITDYITRCSNVGEINGVPITECRGVPVEIPVWQPCTGMSLPGGQEDGAGYPSTGGGGTGTGDPNTPTTTPPASMDEVKDEYKLICPKNFVFTDATSDQSWMEAGISEGYCRMVLIDAVTKQETVVIVELPTIYFGIPHINSDNNTTYFSINEAKALAADAFDLAEYQVRQAFKANPQESSDNLARLWIQKMDYWLKRSTYGKGMVTKQPSRNPATSVVVTKYSPCVD